MSFESREAHPTLPLPVKVPGHQVRAEFIQRTAAGPHGGARFGAGDWRCRRQHNRHTPRPMRRAAELTGGKRTNDAIRPGGAAAVWGDQAPLGSTPRMDACQSRQLLPEGLTFSLPFTLKRVFSPFRPRSYCLMELRVACLHVSSSNARVPEACVFPHVATQTL